MADVMGTQGGMEGIVGAGKNINEASKRFGQHTGIFESSVGEWTFGVLMVKDIFKKFLDGFKDATTTSSKNFIVNLKEGFKDAFEFGVNLFKNAGWAKVADTISSTIGSRYDVRKQLQGIYGAFGTYGDRLTDGINEVTKATNDFGARWQENMTSFMAIADRIGSTNLGGDWKKWIEETSLISKSFGIGEDAAANISSSFMMGGASAKTMHDFMENINRESQRVGLSPADVANNIAQSNESMMRFSQSSAKANSLLLKMATTSTKLGVSIDDMVGAMDKYKTIEGAMQGSVDLSLMGINMDAMQLLAQASQNDPTALFDTVMNKLSGYSNPDGTFSNVGRMMAQQLAPMLGMSTDDLQKAMKRSKSQNPTDALNEYKTMKDKANKQQTAMDNLTDAMYQLVRVVGNLTEPLTRLIDWAAQSKAASITFISGVLFLGFVLKSIVPMLIRFLGQKSLFVGLEMMTQMGGKGGKIGQWGLDKIFGKTNSIGNAGDEAYGNIPRGRNRRGGSIPNVDNGVNNINKMKGAMYGSIGTAVSMIGFAGAVFILAKAMQEFAKLPDWNAVAYGTATMVTFGTVFAGITKSLGALGSDPITWVGIAALVAFAGAIMMVGKGMQWSGEGFKSFGEGLKNIKESISGVVKLGDIGPIQQMIISVGEMAIKYQAPINLLANGMTNLATAMGNVQKMTLSTVNIDAIEKLAKIQSQYPALLAMGGNGGDINLTLYTDVSIDGNKVARATTTAVQDRGIGRR